ncbi:MAG TPA: RsmE family RNA methyltransferase [Candidatus Acidoferrum sp.]|jgi:16S rRNA (uracil1498-N3)-methyltransferase
MRRRFFVEQFENQQAVMEGEAAHHLGRVLRAQAGQLYELSDGANVWLAEIESVTRDRVQFKLLESLPAHKSSLETILLLSVVKFDAFEWALEKATELGVVEIVPLAAERSEKGLLAAAIKRSERWQKILLESSQQSRRVQLPRLHSVNKPEAAFSLFKDGVCVMLSESPEANPLKTVLAGRAAQRAVLAIGPEGGWTDQEFAVARQSGFLEASLGRLILRTETAVVAALANMNFALTSNLSGQSRDQPQQGFIGNT